MKKVFKALALSCAVLMTFSVSAYAKALRVDTRGQVERNISSSNDIFCDDFAAATGGIEEYGYAASLFGDSSVSITSTVGDKGKNIKALLVSDKVPGAKNEGATIKKGIGNITSGKIGVEVKFKMEVPDNTETTFASNGLYLLTTNGQWATRFFVLGDATGGSINWGGSGGGTMYQNKITPGAWYTFTMIADLDAKKVDTMLKSDALNGGYMYAAGLTFDNNFLNMETPGVSAIAFESRMFTADWYFEYIKVTKDPEPIEKPKAQKPTQTITPPVSDTPVMRPVPNTINVLRNGTYAYFAQKPERIGDNVMVSARSVFTLFGMNMTVADGAYKGTGSSGELSISTDGSSISVNGSALDSGCITLKDGKVMVAVNKIAEALGETAEWNDAEQTLYIGGAAQ